MFGCARPPRDGGSSSSAPRRRAGSGAAGPGSLGWRPRKKFCGPLEIIALPRSNGPITMLFHRTALALGALASILAGCTTDLREEQARGPATYVSAAQGAAVSAQGA